MPVINGKGMGVDTGTDYDLVVSIQSEYGEFFTNWTGSVISGSVQSCVSKITDSAPYGVAKVLVVLSFYYYQFLYRGNIPVSVVKVELDGGNYVVRGRFALPTLYSQHLYFEVKEDGKIRISNTFDFD